MSPEFSLETYKKWEKIEKNDNGAFNNYVDKMRGEEVKKCLFLSTLRV